MKIGMGEVRTENGKLKLENRKLETGNWNVEAEIEVKMSDGE